MSGGRNFSLAVRPLRGREPRRPTTREGQRSTGMPPSGSSLVDDGQASPGTTRPPEALAPSAVGGNFFECGE
jgi:hypothetical protein